MMSYRNLGNVLRNQTKELINISAPFVWVTRKRIKGKANGENMCNVSKYLAELVKAQLHGEKPSNLPSDISAAQVIEIAKNNQMNYILLCSLIQTNIEEVEKEKIRPNIQSSLMKALVQNNEIKNILQKLEENQISNQPLKGACLKKIYPQPAQREMSDFDLLIRDDDREKIKEILEGMDYRLEQKVHHHDIYVKEPFMVVEIHHAMFDRTVDQKQYEYFSREFRLEKEKSEMGLSKEDFYIYMMSHMAKHFYTRGCGIRNLVDIYVYQGEFHNQLDENYIQRELEKCGILTFTRHMEKLTRIWLGGEDSSPFYEELFQYMLEGGVYGKNENGIWNEFAMETERGLKKFYYFPSMKYMMHHYPWIHNRKSLLCIAWLIRIARGVCNGKSIQRRRMIQKIDKNKISVMQNIYKEMDLQFK